MSYRNPIPTVDVFVQVGDKDHDRRYVLIRRRNPPHGLAFPGGFVNEGESYEAAAVREIKEETGLDVTLTEQFYTYSSPKRDPRKHITTTVFIGTAWGQTPKAADDAAGVITFPLPHPPPEAMAFDHSLILAHLLRYLATGERPRLNAA